MNSSVILPPLHRLVMDEMKFEESSLAYERLERDEYSQYINIFNTPRSELIQMTQLAKLALKIKQGIFDDNQGVIPNTSFSLNQGGITNVLCASKPILLRRSSDPSHSNSSVLNQSANIFYLHCARSIMLLGLKRS